MMQGIQVSAGLARTAPHSTDLPTVADVPAAPPRWPDRWPILMVFVLSVVMNFAGAWYLSNIVEIGNADGLSRTANAWYVIFSRDPHLSSVGFVWPVLPSLVQIPFLPLARLLNAPEMAGWLMSSVSGAATLAMLALILGRFQVTGWTRLSWLLMVQLHPQFWYLSASGLAEMPALFFLGMAIYGLLDVERDDLALVWIGVALMASFFVRYESLGFMMGFALVITLTHQWKPTRRQTVTGGRLSVDRWPGGRLLVQWWPDRRDRQALEGRLLVLLAPSIYGVMFWILVNGMIMGDPLYFQRSEFSLAAAPDVARNLGPQHPLWHAMGSIPFTALYAAKRLSQVQVAMIPISLLAAALAWKLRSRRILALGTLALVAIGFTCAQIFLGSLPPFLRYWSYTTIFTVVLAGASVSALEQLSRRAALVVRLAVTGMLGLGIVVSATSLTDESASFDERRLGAWLLHDEVTEKDLRAVDFWWIRAHDSRLLAPVLDDVSQHGATLVDVETGYPSILRSRHPQRLVISPDSDFRYILDYPESHLRYIAVTDPKFGGRRDLVNTRFPGLYDGDVPWARLVGELHGTIQPWRIYQVVADPTSPERGGERDGIDRTPFRGDVAIVPPQTVASNAGSTTGTSVFVTGATVTAVSTLPAPGVGAPITQAASQPLPVVGRLPFLDPSRIGTPPATTAGTPTSQGAGVVPATAVSATAGAPTATTVPLLPPAPLVSVTGAPEVIVQEGDTLTSIAEQHGISVSVLAAWNGLNDPDLIFPGERLLLSGESKPGEEE